MYHKQRIRLLFVAFVKPHGNGARYTYPRNYRKNIYTHGSSSKYGNIKLLHAISAHKKSQTYTRQTVYSGQVAEVRILAVSGIHSI
jgi:hypothetical protein